MHSCTLAITLSCLLASAAAATETQSALPHAAIASSTALLQSELLLQFVQQHKHIPRLTYFSCHNTASNDTGNVRATPMELDQLRAAFAAKNAQLIERLYLQSERPFVRIVQLDVLRQLHGRTRSRPGSPVSPSGRDPRVTALSALPSSGDWLNDVLPLEDLRQIVALDLACGILSRRFLELASSKLLFNDKYHWLLIEDYALHAATGVEELPAPDEPESIEQLMETLNFYMNTEVTFAKRATEAESYTLYDVWSPGLNYGGHVNITQIGEFSIDAGLQLYSWFRTTSTLLRRLDMQHARVRCMVVVTNKNMTGTLMYYLTHTVSRHIDTMNRFNFNLLMIVRDMFNWTFVLSRTSTWGYVKNGRFDGMIGALIRNETDIGGAPIFYWLERHKWIDAAGRSWSSRPCFIFRHPRNTQKDRIVFLQPFSNDVWVLILICGVLTVLILWLLTTIEWKLVPHDGAALIKPKGGAPVHHHHQPQQPVARSVSAIEQDVQSLASVQLLPVKGGLWQRCYASLNNYILKRRQQRKSPQRVGLFLESVLFFVGIICQQGLGFSTSFVSGRTIVITSLLFSFCIFQFYSASIVGTLLMEKPKTIRTLSDLVQSSLQVGMEDVVYNRDYFVNTKDPVSLELYAKKITSVPSKEPEAVAAAAAAAAPVEEYTEAPPAGVDVANYRDIVHSHEVGAHAKDNVASNWLDPDTGLRRVKQGRFAFHVDVAAAYKIIQDTFSEREICELTEVSMFAPQKTICITQKNSPMRKVISYGLRRLTETGIFNYQFNIWHTSRPPCVKKIETSDLHVDMDTISSALIILLFSYGITLLVLGIEILYSKLQYRIVILAN
ncbi:ionotropic receptor 75a [Drosophila busckii]|uniref:ionotropic receptor 75a n=1 Tax=Drosophila busckii TaxID=30019 RepID=UPI00083EA985|nr:ionotropic receptor 75a [Drosophila busckii]